MRRQLKVFLLVVITISFAAGAFGTASAGVPRLAGATAVISSPANGALFETGSSIAFDGSKSTGSMGHNTTFEIISWEWTFGDGANDSGPLVRHAYHQAGSFTVTLIVTDSANATGMAATVLYLAPPASPQKMASQPVGGGGFNPVGGPAMALSLAGPTAVISSPVGNALFELGNNVFFDASKSTGTNSGNASYPLVSWDWDVGDGTNVSSMFVNHTYASAGCYVVFLTVRDSMGTSAISSVTIYVSPQARPQNLPTQPQGAGGFNPVSGGGFILALGGANAVISSPANGALSELDQNILFDGSKSTGSSNQNSTYAIVSWNWSFGDGAYGDGTTIVHSYSAGGSYTVTLTVTDSSGASAFTTTVVVIAPKAAPQNIPAQPGGGSSYNPASGGMGII